MSSGGVRHKKSKIRIEQRQVKDSYWVPSGDVTFDKNMIVVLPPGTRSNYIRLQILSDPRPPLTSAERDYHAPFMAFSGHLASASHRCFHLVILTRLQRSIFSLTLELLIFLRLHLSNVVIFNWEQTNTIKFEQATVLPLKWKELNNNPRDISKSSQNIVVPPYLHNAIPKGKLVQRVSNHNCRNWILSKSECNRNEALER